MSNTPSTITPCLWFDGNAEEAAMFYTSLLADSHIDAAHPPFIGLNGGSFFKFNEAVSLQIPVDTQAEVFYGRSQFILDKREK